MTEIVGTQPIVASSPMAPQGVSPEISQAFRDRNPLYALKLYRQGLAIASSPLVVDLRHRYDETMERIRLADEVDAGTLEELAQSHASARPDDSRRMVEAAADRLIALGEDAQQGNDVAESRLRAIGLQFEKLVLKNTLQQQFCGKLAIRLGLKRTELRSKLIDLVVRPLIDPLAVVLLVGAPRTRDSAVEGLGALLKIVNDSDPEHLLKTLRVTNGDSKRDADYAARVDRRRQMALTVAGHQPSCDQYHAKVIDSVLADAIREGKRPELEGGMWERADLLRVLPAIARQNSSASLPWDTADLLRNAAVLPAPRDDEDESVLIAHSAYTESVFRTIDTTLRRPGGHWSQYDAVVAGAVRAIPRTMAGEPGVCNRRIRATVAILRTAIRIVEVSDSRTETEDALEPLFASLATPTAWANHGIAEGCYRGLPALLPRNEHNHRLNRPALAAMFAQLKPSPDANDLVATHRQLIAASCFRRILISLTARLHEQLLLETGDQMQLAERRVEYDIRTLLSNPTRKNVLRAFQERTLESGAGVRSDIDEVVIAGIAFESKLLHRLPEMFEKWSTRSKVDQVLLTRILAAQLHAISRDRPEISRHDALHRVFDEMHTVAMKEPDVMKVIWSFLSSMPPDAAAAADADVQRFVEYRGANRNADDCAKEGSLEDLPGYVLAMVQSATTSRVAGAIAREIDLIVRHDRVMHPARFDLGKSLYQVLLRGPHESVFDHLRSRISDPDDVKMVEQFRKYVAQIRESEAVRPPEAAFASIHKNITSILPTLGGLKGETVSLLKLALSAYVDVGADHESVWETIANGGIHTVFCRFDAIARATRAEKSHTEDHRDWVAELHERELGALRDDVAHYLELPLGNFHDRAATLRKAADHAHHIGKALAAEHGLEAPERILLSSLMYHLERLFRRTIRWYCEEPRRRQEEQDKDGFRLMFAADEASWESLKDPLIGTKDLLHHRQRIEESRQKTSARIEHLRTTAGKEPVRFRLQTRRFEEYFVEWMASELDVQQLRQALWSRWPGWFKSIYRIITSFWRTTIAILIPCLIAIALDLAGVHWLAGIGFFVVALAMLAAVVLSFSRFIEHLRHVFHEKTPPDKPAGYWFPCMLPRLARLIAVPMTLIVEFDHSYAFPLHGSTWVLALLMALAFLTTHFFVMREIVDRTENPGVFLLNPIERSRVWQIVAVALAHSFGVAMLMSMIFATTHVHEMKSLEKEAVEVEPYVAASGLWSPWASVLRQFDETDQFHEYPRFVGLLPREVKVDFGTMWDKFGWTLPTDVRKHAQFVFYPTIILTWTALGLFFGVFLEGFLKGERLRGGPGAARAEADR